MNAIEILKHRLSDHQPKMIKEAMPEAGILVPLTRELDPHFILTRRAQHMNTHQGQVAFPGGKHDEDDASLIHTALRECHEEIGVAPSKVEVIGPLSQVVSLHGIRVSPYVGLVDPGVNLEPNLDELDSIFKVPVSYFLSEETTRRDKMTYKGMALSVPSYDYSYQGENYQIWGLSAIVLVELMNVVFDADIRVFEDYKSERKTIK